MKRILRSYDSYDVDALSLATGLACLDVSRTIQSQKDEADINVIVRNFGVTGKVPVSAVAPTYGAFDGVDDYRSAIDAIRAAEASFFLMPSALRARFDNDPQGFVEFCSDPSNLPEMRKLGLAVPETAAAVPPVSSPPGD